MKRDHYALLTGSALSFTISSNLVYGAFPDSGTYTSDVSSLWTYVAGTAGSGPKLKYIGTGGLFAIDAHAGAILTRADSIYLGGRLRLLKNSSTVIDVDGGWGACGDGGAAYQNLILGVVHRILTFAKNDTISLAASIKYLIAGVESAATFPTTAALQLRALQIR